MNNKLSDLNNILFEQLERLNDDEYLNEEENFKKEMQRTKAIAQISGSIINNAKNVLEAIKIKEEFGIENSMPMMLNEK